MNPFLENSFVKLFWNNQSPSEMLVELSKKCSIWCVNTDQPRSRTGNCWCGCSPRRGCPAWGAGGPWGRTPRTRGSCAARRRTLTVDVCKNITQALITRTLINHTTIHKWYMDEVIDLWFHYYSTTMLPFPKFCLWTKEYTKVNGFSTIKSVVEL